MADLTIEDFETPDIAVKEIQFLGKRGFIRELLFDEQMEIAELFAGREDEEADPGDMKVLLAYTLCHENGVLLFALPDGGIDIDRAKRVLGQVSGKQLLELFETIQIANGMNEAEAEKNLTAVP